MNVSGESSSSLWMSTAEEFAAPALQADASADVVVIGSGIAGLSTAYELVRMGKSVIVVDRGKIAGGMSARTTAHLASAFDDYYFKHTSLRGREESHFYFESQSAAIDRIEAIVEAEQIDCDFRRLDGYLFAARTADEDLLRREREACLQLGMSVELVPMTGLESALALRFPAQARFHPLKYLSGLARCIVREGGRIFADTPVTNVAEQGGEVVVETQAGQKIRAAAAVVATNSPINDRVAIHTKQAPYRTYAIACRIPSGCLADALYWDTCEPYHYVRLQPGADHDWVIVGGEDHKTGEAEDFDARLERLEQWILTRLPQASRAEYRWSGQVMEPVDHAPYLGRNPGNKNIYIATGDSGEGMTTGVVASLLIPALIAGRDVPWAATYAPDRVTLGAAVTYLSENATVVSNMTEYLRGGEVTTVDQLQPGQAALIGRGRDKVAAYRDPSGLVHARSAVCTHAGCIVHWNAMETCWDCPCHGSQFSIDGEPLNGPAIYPLGEAK